MTEEITLEILAREMRAGFAQQRAHNEDALFAVNEGFAQMEQRFIRMDARLDRIEKIVDHWPPPSQIKELLSLTYELNRRVKTLEKQAGIAHE